MLMILHLESTTLKGYGFKNQKIILNLMMIIYEITLYPFLPIFDYSMIACNQL